MKSTIIIKLNAVILRFIKIIILLISFCLSGICYAGPVDSIQAKTRVHSLLQSSFPTAYMQTLTRKDYPPFSKCLVFEVTLPAMSDDDTVAVRDATASGGFRWEKVPPKPYKAKVWVEQDTGKILSYEPEPGYTYSKHKKADDSEPLLMPVDRLRANAQDFIRRAGIDTQGMRLIKTGKMAPQLRYHYYGYYFTWARYVTVEGVGDVEIPEQALISMDAVTGDVDFYLYKHTPITIEIKPPVFSKEEAEKLAVQCCEPRDIALKETALLVYSGYSTKEDIQVLAWRVRIRETNQREGLSNMEAIVDAHSGTILSCLKNMRR